MSNMVAEVPREKLKELVEKNGDGLLQDPDRCEGLLKDHCGAHRREISALVGALEERVPMELKSSWQSAMTPEAMRARLVQRLEDNRGLAPEVATWAVDAWSYALGVGLTRQSDRLAGTVAGAVGVGVAGAGLAEANANPVSIHDWFAHGPSGGELASTGSASVAERVASDRAGGATLQPVAAAGKLAALQQMSTPKKAGAGAIALLLLAGIGIAAARHPKLAPPAPAPAPAPVNPDPNAGRNTTLAGGNDGSAPTVIVPGGEPLIDAGTPIIIRLDHAVNSDTASVGELLPATVMSPVTEAGNVVVSTGAKAHVKIVALDRTGTTGGAAHVQLALVDVAADSGRLRLSTFAKTFDGPVGSVKGATRAGIGAATGAVGGFVVGKLFHHGKTGAATGATAGAAIGAASAKPDPVKVAAATVIRFRLSRAAVQS